MSGGLWRCVILKCGIGCVEVIKFDLFRVFMPMRVCLIRVPSLLCILGSIVVIVRNYQFSFDLI